MKRNDKRKTTCHQMPFFSPGPEPATAFVPSHFTNGHFPESGHVPTDIHTRIIKPSSPMHGQLVLDSCGTRYRLTANPVSGDILKNDYILYSGIFYVIKKHCKQIQATNSSIMESKKPIAVLVTNFLPYPGWGGAHMRAWDWLKTLSRDYRVHVIVTNGYSDISLIDENYPAERVWSVKDIRFQKLKLFEKWFKWPFLVKWNPRHIRDLTRIDPETPFKQELVTSLKEADIRRVLIYKLQNHEFGQWFAKTFPHVPVELDMDDYESRSRQSIGQACMKMGKFREGKRMLRQARQYHVIETDITGPYQCLYLANRDDCDTISSRLAPRIVYRPNRITVPDTFPAPPDKGTHLLFIGTLHYLPNVEAIHFLLDELVPLLRRELGNQWHLTIAGRSPSDEIRQRCEHIAEVTLESDVKTLLPLYERTHIVLVPLFSGSGTKLKSLEAMAHRRPIVSTREGVRGLNLENGTHYLHAETAAEFASAIKTLASNRDHARLIGQTGYDYCRQTFSVVP